MKPHRLEIRFADIDVMGHVNNAIYLNYFEQGRIQYFNQRIGGEWNWDTYGIIVARNEIDYLQPILLNDEVYITVAFGTLGNKSFQMEMRVFKMQKGNEIDCALGKVTVVCYDYIKKCTIPVPDIWKTAAGNKAT